ncbi:MAG: lipoyl protein ligase domain-containing protein, partial [Planctomycetota bacterium]
MIEVEDLGIISFESAYRYQKECVEKIRTNNSPGKLLLMEHYDCITAGMSTTRDEIGQLKKCKFDSKVSIIETDRGGKITAHNVGQLIGYPIINLKLAKLSIIKFIEKVLTCVSRAVGYFQINPKVVIEKNRT